MSQTVRVKNTGNKPLQAGDKYKVPPIKVRINPDGITAREVNPLGERPDSLSIYVNGLDDAYNQWQQAEASCRNFEIESEPGIFHGYESGVIVEAQIISNGKIKIL